MTRQKLALACGLSLVLGSVAIAQAPLSYQTATYRPYGVGYGTYGGYQVTPIGYSQPTSAYATAGYRNCVAADLRPSTSYAPVGYAQPYSAHGQPYSPYAVSPYRSVGSNYYVGQNWLGEPKLYGRNEPLRNILRFISL